MKSSPPHCDKLLSMLGEYRCEVKSHKMISVELTNHKAPGVKILDRLSVSADICLYISDYRNIGKIPYRCKTTYACIVNSAKLNLQQPSNFSSFSTDR